MVKPAYRALMINGIQDFIIPYFENIGFSLELSRNVKVFGPAKSRAVVSSALGILLRFLRGNKRPE